MKIIREMNGRKSVFHGNDKFQQLEEIVCKQHFTTLERWELTQLWSRVDVVILEVALYLIFNNCWTEGSRIPFVF